MTSTATVLAAGCNVPNTNYRPTLYKLLDLLSSDRVTTFEQRTQIRAAVIEFLNNDIPHSRLYAHLGQIVGHQMLYEAVHSLGQKTTEKLSIETGPRPSESPQPVPPQIDEAPDLTTWAVIPTEIRQSRDEMKLVGSTVRVATLEGFGTIRLETLPTAFPIPSHRAVPRRWGHRALSLDTKGLILGGGRRAGHKNPSSTFDRLLVLNLWDLDYRRVACYGEVPPSAVGFSANILSLARPFKGPMVVIFGGCPPDTKVPGNAVYILLLNGRRWEEIESLNPPPPRTFHIAAPWPFSSQVIDSSSQTLATNPQKAHGLVVWGGTGVGGGMCTNEVWYFAFNSTAWTVLPVHEESIHPPPAVEGAAAVWLSNDELLVFGGVDGNGTVSDAVYILSMHSSDCAPISISWKRLGCEENIARAHHSLLLLKQPGGGGTQTLVSIGGLGGDGTLAKTILIGTVGGGSCVWMSKSVSMDVYRKDGSALYFAAASADTKELAPLVYLTGGTSSDQVAGTSVISLHGTDVFRESNFLEAANVGIGESSDRESQDISGMMSSDEDDTLRRGDAAAGGMSQVAKQERLRRLGTLAERMQLTPGIFWVLASMCRWPMAALGLLIDNATSPIVAATKVEIEWGRSPRGAAELVVQDDGRGMDVQALNSLLKKFGNSPASTRGRKPHEYGIGFKVAVSRLAESCLVMSRTVSSVGVGLLSQELLGQINAQSVTSPICVWSLPSRELVSSGLAAVDYRHSQRLLMTHSHYASPTTLAEQINRVGSDTGSRLLFWGLRRDLTHFRLSEQTGGLYLAHAPLTVEDDVKGAEGVEWCKEASGRSFVKADPAKLLQPNFPFWDSPRDSIDFSVATYLFWHRLYHVGQLVLNDVKLAPTDLHSGHTTSSGSSSPDEGGDVHRNSLFRTLKSHLFCQVQLPYLFTVADGEMGAHALIGLLNDPSEPSKLCEAGVLLYHQERLISRFRLPFPSPVGTLAAPSSDDDPKFLNLTAVISVPRWMIPRPGKEDFVHEQSDVWQKFDDKLSALLRKYLSLKDDPVGLSNWSQFRASRVAERNQIVGTVGRFKRRLSEGGAEDDEKNKIRKIETVVQCGAI